VQPGASRPISAFRLRRLLQNDKEGGSDLEFVGAAAVALACAACGTNPSDRTTGGAAAVTAAGAGVGALGGPVGALAGAAICGGVGAIAGATTSPSDVNLGPPPWSNSEVPPLDDDRRQARRSRDRQTA
jgi:hypothetical protein